MPKAFNLIRATRASYILAYCNQQRTPELAAATALSGQQVRALAYSLGISLSARAKRPVSAPRRGYTRFSITQVEYLRTHYAELSVAHFAQRWGVTTEQVYGLAARHGISRRAPNGQPVWRGGGQHSLWPEGSRWAV